MREREREVKMERNTEYGVKSRDGGVEERAIEIYIQRESERENEGKDERRANGMRTKEK